MTWTPMWCDAMVAEKQKCTHLLPPNQKLSLLYLRQDNNPRQNRWHFCTTNGSRIDWFVNFWKMYIMLFSHHKIDHRKQSKNVHQTRHHMTSVTLRYLPRLVYIFAWCSNYRYPGLCSDSTPNAITRQRTFTTWNLHLISLITWWRKLPLHVAVLLYILSWLVL
jgi:hypothetical protein